MGSGILKRRTEVGVLRGDSDEEREELLPEALIQKGIDFNWPGCGKRQPC